MDGESAAVQPVVEGSVHILGQLGEVHVLQDLYEGGPGGGLQALTVQPAPHYLHVAGVHP